MSRPTSPRRITSAAPPTLPKPSDRIAIVDGDITALAVDAIVNAANTMLAPGGGVCGAIHRAAGPDLAEACAKLGGCDTGEAKITPGFRLPARYVIHTVGPVWSGGGANEDLLLAACYRNSLALAEAHGLKSIAFPAISTGIYGFPPDRAASNRGSHGARRATRLAFDRARYVLLLRQRLAPPSRDGARRS